MNHFDFWHAENHLLKEETELYFFSSLWSDMPPHEDASEHKMY